MQLLCRFECALIRPERDASALKVPVAHGALIGVADDGHLIADRLADVLNNVDILFHRRHKQPQLHGAKTFVEQAERILLPFLVAAQLAHSGIGRDMVTVAAHDLVRRQTGLFAENIPEGVLDDPRSRCEPPVALETGGQLFDHQRVLPDEPGGDHVLNECHICRRQAEGKFTAAVALDPLVRHNADKQDVLVRFTLPGIPRRFKGLIVGNFEPIGLDSGDLHSDTSLFIYKLKMPGQYPVTAEWERRGMIPPLRRSVMEWERLK